jgi:hypothetical protein
VHTCTRACIRTYIPVQICFLIVKYLPTCVLTYNCLSKCFFCSVWLIIRKHLRGGSCFLVTLKHRQTVWNPNVTRHTSGRTSHLQYMLTHVHMEWARLLVITRGTGIFLICFRVCRCLCCHCRFCQTKNMDYKFSGGHWVTGQLKPFFHFFC